MSAVMLESFKKAEKETGSLIIEFGMCTTVPPESNVAQISNKDRSNPGLFKHPTLSPGLISKGDEVARCITALEEI
jgi:hypothetical protein